MTAEEIKNDLQLKCKKQTVKKIFSIEEIHGIALMLDENQIGIKRASEYFHTDYRKMQRLIELIKQNGDNYEKTCQEINQ